MSGPVEIAIGVSHRSWAQRLFRHVADHGGAVVRTRVLLDEDALEASFAVLVVDNTASVLTPRMVAELHRRDRRVIAGHTAGDHQARETLRRLGVDAAFPDSAPPEELVDAIVALAPAPASGSDDPFAAIARELGHELAGDAEPPPRERPAGRPARGLVTVVLAVSGGTGATEVALALAGVLGGRRERTVLVDADEVAPAMAQRMAHAQVLVNAGPSVEEVTAAGGIARHGIARAMLLGADQLVVVAAATPIGLSRLLVWLGDHTGLARSKPLHVALNQAPAGAFKRGELEREVLRSFLPSSLHLLPADRRVAEAVWNGRAVPSGPFQKAVQALGAELPVAPVIAAAGRAGWNGYGRAARRAGRRGAAR